MVKFLDKNSGFNQWMANTQQKSETKPSKLSGFFWWMVILLLAWWLFSLWFTPKSESVATQSEPVVIENVATMAARNIDSDKISLNAQGLRISDIKLKDYKKVKNESENISLLAGENEFIEVGFIANGTTAPTNATVWKMADGAMSWRNSDGIEFTRHTEMRDYVIVIRDEIKNTGRRDVSFVPYARISRGGGEDSSAAVSVGAIAYVNSDIETNDWSRLDKKSYIYQTNDGFVGFADQYWETVVSIGAPDQTMRMRKVNSNYQADASAAPFNVAAGSTIAIETNIFAGPRDQSATSSAANDIAGIGETIDYGWFWFLAQPMLWGLNAIHGFVHNYGLAIILLTIILRLMMWPLTRKSYVAMAAMQKMQPEMQRIQKLYKNDKARQQMELMKLYQTSKTSPMSGCLPMLLQIPIFFALYKALLISVPMRQAHFLWISDLSVMDPFFILPILMGATMWWQQRLQSGAQAANPSSNDPMAQTMKMMKWLPVVFTVLFAFMPAGLVLYWMVSNLFGIGQIYVIKKTMDK